ncbi:MAG: alpha/beta hydrolase [Pseudomonadota bacterium]
MIRYITQTAIRLLACALALGLSPAQAQSGAGIIAATEAFPVSPPASTPSERFYLSVPENREAPDAARVELPVVVLKSKTPGDKAPIVMITGGPGTAGLSAARYPGAYPWVGKRDFVVFGQRGTHYARPSLMCPGYRASMAEQADQEAKAAAIRQCAAELAEQGIDRSAYATTASAHDLEDLRKAIGAEQLSLYGLSYGTRLAIAYAREYPDRVASIVLDGPLPFAASYDTELPANIEAVLRAIAQRCAARPACEGAYPKLWHRFSQALAKQASSPPSEGSVSPSDVALYIVPGSKADIAQAPRLMDAFARGNLAPFVGSDGSFTPSNFAWGMRLSVWCAERESAKAISDAPFAGIDSPTFADFACEAWDVPMRPTSELQDYSGDVPVLILAGEYDAITPPAFGARLLSGLNHAELMAVPAGLHAITTNWGGTGCAMSLAARFFEAPKAFLADPERLGCLASEPYPEFELGPIEPDTQPSGGAP